MQITIGKYRVNIHYNTGKRIIHIVRTIETPKNCNHTQKKKKMQLNKWYILYINNM